MAAATASTFWTRMRISETERLVALKAIRSRYDGYCVREHEEQGLCSYTLLLTAVHTSSSPLLCSREQRTTSPCSLLSRRRRDATPFLGQFVIQLRGPAHLLDLDLAEAAWKLYHPLAPQIRLVDDVPLPGALVAYEMNRVEGTPLSRVLQRRWDAVRDGHGKLSMEEEEKMCVLVRSFAQMIAKSWPEKAGPRQRRDSVIQPHPPPHKNTDMLSLCTGKVGSQITRKLSQLAQQLPDERLRAKAQSTLDQIRQVVGDWPVVLTHGDLISSNLLVDEESWAVCGLVDWAEAEYLPFGTCLYGLEEMLGCLENPVPVSVPQPELELEAEVEEQARDVGKMWRFVYTDGADRYRTLFFHRLLELVPQIRGREEVLWAMRDLGVLLWHGFAWDGGKIDRVVNGVDDGEELAKLRAMLAVRLDIRDCGNGNG